MSSLRRRQRIHNGREVSAPAGPTTFGRGGLASGTVRPAVLLLARTLFVPLASAAPLSLWQHSSIGTLEDDVDSPKSPDDPNLWAYLGVAVALVLLGGAFAGLTIALMGQDETYLQVIATSGEGSEKKHANKVLNLLKRGKHWVLVTLLLSNVITNETLPIVLDRSLGGGWPAVLSSTVLIVIFGEIAPQSVCVRYGLSIGSFMAPFVLVLMWIMAPVAWPTAKLLDWLLGEDHGTMYKKAGLKTLVQLHKSLGTTAGERLMEDEVTIINSVLDLKDKAVGDIMTPMQDVFTMSADTVLDERMMDTILSQGYSRIPIYAPDNNRNFIGMLLVKILITYDPEDAKRVREFALATLPETAPYTSCLDIINFFQEGKSHMVLVSDYPGQDEGALGVLTLEDVIEELIGEEIIDESDVFVDVHKAIRRLAPAPKQRYSRSTSRDPLPTNDPEQDAAHEAGEDEPLLGTDTANVRPGLPRAATTFLRRRKSSTTSDTAKDGKLGAVPVRSSAVNMREHLRHLGPSNAASKPRATHIRSVKIKPGVGTIPENHATTTGTNGGPPRSRSVDTTPIVDASAAPDASEGTALLTSAGPEASDGAAALEASYGTISSSPSAVKRPNSADEMSAKEASRVAEQNARPVNDEQQQNGIAAETNDNRLKVPEKMVVGDSSVEGGEDQLGEMEAPSRERSKSRRAARSGSITETMVDVGGMKKTVLDISSSSEETAEENEREGEGGKREGGGASYTNWNGSAEDGRKKRKKRGKRKKGGDGS